ncbi:glucosamine-6-phosphate deaminase [Aquibacillus halophilus]|uniref:Glucosamine-6-phosphate deaminase n=1 Tax=Aquibacillus halophilus TaxID=930132 RepID=A0A6A8DBX2_9BACI|nr:glucosamine-6-phosphate deaminase [Aquibacillus halophilus]MRH41271.1 glucosamine-6-phosphate deaminase [Aquibacillus halophilus]
MKIITAKDYSNMSEIAASTILERVKQSSKITLGLATGGTPVKTYNYLINDYKNNKTSYQHVVTFNLDEYTGMKPTNPNSYHYYMEKNLFEHIDIPNNQTHLPNGAADDFELECKTYEQKIAEHNGVDLQILGLGSNGHIGFNEPGTAFDTRTHIVDLSSATRKANARYFDNIDEVPTQAITMGIATILESKEILLLVSGERKSRALEKLLHGEIDTSFPASILNQHKNVTIIADNEALKYVDISSSMIR